MMRTGSVTQGWLVSLADLSLILFIVTAGAIAGDRAENKDPAFRPGGTPQLGIAEQIYVDEPGAPLFETFLVRHVHGPAEQLNITGHFEAGERAAIARRVEHLAMQAAGAGHVPRTILQPSAQSMVYVHFAHDIEPQLAHSLHRSGDNPDR